MFKWVALMVVTAAIVVAGILVAHSISHRTTTVITPQSSGSQSARPSSLFNPDETAFVKVCMTDQGTPHNVQSCDCIYHSLRSQGHPASTLAVASNLLNEFGADIGRADVACSGLLPPIPSG